MNWNDCFAEITDSQFVIGNSLLERNYSLNNGNLITGKLVNKVDGMCWNGTGEPDMVLPGEEGAELVDSEIKVVEETPYEPAYLSCRLDIAFNQLLMRRIFKVYPDCPVIVNEFYFKGKPASIYWSEATSGDFGQIENVKITAQKQTNTVLEQISLGRMHTSYTSSTFYDVTDWNNNLVEDIKGLAYRNPKKLSGQLLRLQKCVEKSQLFILKVAPCSNIQLANEGDNFTVDVNKTVLSGIGLVPQNIKEDEWVSGYGFVTGVCPDGDWEYYSALRKYQKQLRKMVSGRDNMILLNTWGDRNQDASLGETFAMKEIDKAAKLGVTHFQLDDGWQKGVSKNSVHAGGSNDSIWENYDGFWEVHPEKFPNGLQPVVDYAKQNSVELCLWFNPSEGTDFADWECDADCLIGLYNQYEIRTFKIDGVIIANKTAEENLKKMFDKMADNITDLVLNLDVTAGKRFGYHYFSKYGNKFLENRYTDWGNYYPHWTLRNLWQLSAYVPAESLQIEFLNKWRNAERYPEGDVLKPYNLPFSYIFALTMPAQPLAWFEATGLPEEAFSIADTIASYKEHQLNFQNGITLPIGDEPDGFSWTGFQSVNENGGYVLILREKNESNTATIKLWNVTGKELNFELVCGDGATFTATPDGSGAVEFGLPDEFNFALYKY